MSSEQNKPSDRGRTAVLWSVALFIVVNCGALAAGLYIDATMPKGGDPGFVTFGYLLFLSLGWAFAICLSWFLASFVFFKFRTGFKNFVVQTLFVLMAVYYLVFVIEW